MSEIDEIDEDYWMIDEDVALLDALDDNVKSDTRLIKGTTKISEDDKRRRLLVETLLASLKAFNLAVDLWIEEELNDRPNS